MLTNRQSLLGPLARKSLLAGGRPVGPDSGGPAGVPSNGGSRSAGYGPGDSVGPPVSPNVLACEQAIFTSAHNGMGEGYRIIACSPGIGPEEKQEITRRSPSHGSLLLERGSRYGLLAYPLASGRYCVACCCHAGIEHTARGGQRVYTHIVVLDDSYRLRLGGNPLPVHRFLSNLITYNRPQLRPPVYLEPLLVPVVSGPDEFRSCRVKPGPDAEALEEEWTWPLLGELLGGRRAILSGLSDPWSLLSRIWLSAPRDLRAGWSVSVGVRYAPARSCDLTLLDAADPAACSLTDGRLKVWTCSQKPPPVASESQSWCGLMQRWFTLGETDGIAELTGDILAPCRPGELARLVPLCEDLHRARLDPSLDNREAIRSRYAETRAASPVEAVLLEQLARLTAENCAGDNGPTGEGLSPENIARPDQPPVRE